MATNMIEVVSSYNDVQFTATPDLTAEQIAALSKFLTHQKIALLDFRDEKDFDFEFAARSYTEPNSVNRAKQVGIEVKEYFRKLGYRVCYKNLVIEED